MIRRYRICNAILSRWWYLLTVGMWKHECAFTAFSEGGRIVYIGTCTGSMFGNELDFEIKRTFYTEDEK